jgi:hypothetical protein
VATSSLLLVDSPIKRLWYPGNRLFAGMFSMFKKLWPIGKIWLAIFGCCCLKTQKSQTFKKTSPSPWGTAMDQANEPGLAGTSLEVWLCHLAGGGLCGGSLWFRFALNETHFTGIHTEFGIWVPDTSG